jgi:uncharacterized protein (DUF2249 family)
MQVVHEVVDTMTEIDVREIPPNERHDRIHATFEGLDAGETLTIINDHDPKPLYYEMAAEVPTFDEDAYTLEREEPSKFVAQFPKVEADPTVDRADIGALDGEPHADVFPGRSPKTVRLSLTAGESLPEHEHPERNVLFQVLSGAVDLSLDGEVHRVKAGEILRFDGDKRIEPVADEDSTALVVLAPKAAE